MRNFVTIGTFSALLAASAALGFGVPEERPAVRVATSPTVFLKVPVSSELFSGVPVARVDDETVTVKELWKTLEISHRAMAEGKEPPKISPLDIVNRLVNVRLFLKEARTIGLDELPEVKQELDAYSEETLRKMIIADLAKDAKTDKEEAERLFREEVREYKLRSVMFPKEEDAKAMAAALKDGKSFEELADRAVKEEKGKSSAEQGFVRHDKLLPELEAAAGKLAVGGVSAPVQITFQRLPAWVILRLEEVRYPEDPAARGSTEQKALLAARQRAFNAAKAKMIKADVKFKKKIIDTLDFEAKSPGLDALAKDKRVIVEVRGEKPVTVGELATTVKESFYHGVGNASKKGLVNRKKLTTLDDIVEKRLFASYGRKKDLKNSDAYKEAMKNYETSVLFTAFVNKAVVPDVKVTDEDAQAYYADHKRDFAYPEMVRMRSLAFETPAQAQSALEKLQKGADFGWTRANSEGRLDEVEKGLLAFDGKPLMITTLPGELRDAISGAKPGDVRLFSHNQAEYVLVVDEKTPPQERPFEDVKEQIGQKLYGLKLQEAIEAWSSKLREASKVEVYLVDMAKQEAK